MDSLHLLESHFTKFRPQSLTLDVLCLTKDLERRLGQAQSCQGDVPIREAALTASVPWRSKSKSSGEDVLAADSIRC